MPLTNVNDKCNVEIDLTDIKSDDSNAVKERKLRKYLSQIETHYNEYKLELSDNPPKSIISDKIGWDGEYVPATEDTPQKPVTDCRVFNVNTIPSIITQSTPLIHKGKIAIYKASDIVPDVPRLLYIYTTDISIFPNVPPSVSSEKYFVGFVWDVQGIKAGIEYSCFFNASFTNIQERLGIKPSNNSDGNSKLITTYSEAELANLIPTLSDEVQLRKTLNIARDASFNEDINSKIITMQGSTIISDYPIWSEGTCLYKLDIIDTRHLGGNSVASIGEALGLDKIKGFDFNLHTADYYMKHHELDFCYYNFIDALLSSGSELFIHKAQLDIVDDLFFKGITAQNWIETKSTTVSTREYAERKRTSSGIGEVVCASYLKKLNKTKTFTDNSVKLEELIHPNDLSVQGGLNQRTTGNVNPEFFDNINTWDFSSHYPYCMKALGDFPLYEPVGVGFMRDSAKSLYERLDELDWYSLKCSFTYDNDTPLNQRLLLQSYNGTSINPECVENIDLTPPLLAVIKTITPDIKITIHSGWQWDRELLEDYCKTHKSNPDNYYINFNPLIDALLELRQKYKDENNKLMEQAVKLIMNSIYGKLAQLKMTYDVESLDLTLINNGDISSIANKTQCRSKITHPTIANAITSLGRAITWWLAYKNDAVLTVTDSIAVLHNDDINLSDYCINDKYIDSYLTEGSIKLETPNPTMGIITGVRGRTLMDYDEKLCNFIKSLDINSDWDDIKTVLSDYVERKQENPPPKIAKDGLKYDGDGWEQWYKCTLHSISRYIGKPITHEQSHLTKRNEVRQGKAKVVNYQYTKSTNKDITEPRSGRYRTYDDYLAVKRFYDKVKRCKNDKYQNLTAGQIQRFHPEWFEAELKKSKSRKRPSKQVPIEIQRCIAIICKLGLVSQSQFAELLGIKKQSISHWVKKLEAGFTTDYWGEKVFRDYQKIKNSYKNVAEGVEQLRQKTVELDNETDTKRATNHLQQALNELEKYFEVRFERKSKRNKKLIAVA